MTGIRFSERELKDLAVAWLALGVAFTVFIDRSIVSGLLRPGVGVDPAAVALDFAISLGTVGIGFLLHELAHKVVAVRFGQLAEFRADYSMLFLTVVGGLAGFLFAAPGAVHHRGRISERENGLIAVAGPVVNIALGFLFVALFVGAAIVEAGLLARVGARGLSINFLLAGFNMLPVGPLDGRTVLRWSRSRYALVAVPSVLLGLAALLLGPGL